VLHNNYDLSLELENNSKLIKNFNKNNKLTNIGINLLQNQFEQTNNKQQFENSNKNNNVNSTESSKIKMNELSPTLLVTSSDKNNSEIEFSVTKQKLNYMSDAQSISPDLENIKIIDSNININSQLN